MIAVGIFQNHILNEPENSTPNYTTPLSPHYKSDFKWIEIYSEVEFLFSYAPTLPLYFESIINYYCIGLEQKYAKEAF